MKKIMILGASILQLPAIEKAINMGLQVVVVDMNPEAVGFSVEGVQREVISTIDTPAVLEAASRHQIDGIMTLATDMPMQTVATVAKELNLIGITEDTALKATNKAYMREALKAYGVPIPMFFRVSSKQNYLDAVNAIRLAGYRCIVKPADNSGSRGIDLLSDYEQETIERAYEYSKQSSRSGELMVEEFMEGPEVSVETLSVDGKCYVIQITDKLTTGAPYFVEMGHSQPSQLPEKIKEKIAEVAIAANHAIGIENGPSHTEIKVTNDGPKIVELGARLGGDNITTHLVPLSTGVDMVECCIQIALGEKPDLNVKFNKGSAVRYFKVSEGKIINIVGVSDAEKVDGVRQVSVVHGVGESLNGIRSSGDRAGFVIAQGETPESAVKACEMANEMISVEVE
jgi:biotin carboxylase